MSNMSKTLTRLSFATALLLLARAYHVQAQSDQDSTDGQRSTAKVSGESATVKDSSGSGQTQDDQSDPGTVERVMDQLMRQRKKAPVVEPRRPAEVNPQPPQPSRVGQPIRQTRVDRAVTGTAPDSDQPDLLPEGTFIVNRRGRLVRADGGRILFSFDADDADSPEAPMILLPCRKLQDMEQYVESHGDDTVFKVSGEVHFYRGANYLMPTMMVAEIDRGNLRN